MSLISVVITKKSKGIYKNSERGGRMEYAIISKHMVRSNKCLRKNQKLSKKRYGKVRGLGPKLKLNKLYNVDAVDFMDLTGEKQVKEQIEVPKDLTEDILINSLLNNALMGLSGNGYSTADKLKQFSKHKNSKGILIKNSVECDPGLAHDEWLLRNRFQEVKTGIEVLNHCFSFQTILLATKLAFSLQDAKIKMVQVPNRYPMGYEKVLLKNLLDIDLDDNEYPAQRGILVLNIQTVLAIGAIICSGKKLDSRYLTVEDLTTGTAVVVKANLGMDAKEVITKALPRSSKEAIYVGEGVMNSHPLEKAEKISAVTNYITYGKEPAYHEASKCKGCGGCNRKCPMQIKVKQIVKKTESGDLTDLEQFHLERCIGCNSCTYVCHAGKNLKEIIADAKEHCTKIH